MTDLSAKVCLETGFEEFEVRDDRVGHAGSAEGSSSLSIDARLALGDDCRPGPRVRPLASSGLALSASFSMPLAVWSRKTAPSTPFTNLPLDSPPKVLAS